MVLIDTSVWSLALRRKHSDLSPAEQDLKSALQELVLDDRAQIVGSVRRARSTPGSAIDFPICAVAHLRDREVFTTDRDFVRYSKALPLRLY